MSPAEENFFGCSLVTWFSACLNFLLLFFPGAEEELFIFPQEVLSLRLGKYASWPSTSGKTVRSLEKKQTPPLVVASFTLKHPWARALPPLRTLTPGASLPQWGGSPLPLQLHVVSTHRMSASKACCFYSFYISYFLFPFSIVFTPNNAKSEIS